MKLSCDREKFLAAFQTVSAVAPARSPKPILQNVKLEASGETVTLMATDLEVGVRIEVPGVDLTAPGAAILPVGRFGSILRESSDERLRIEADARETVVRGDRSEFKLQMEDPAEFPAVAGFHEEKYHELAARLMREMIRRTVFATDNESSRYALGGVLWELGPERAIAVGTDGRRLAKMEGPARSVGGHQTPDNTTIVPTRAMQLIERALAAVAGSEAEATAQMAVTGHGVLVRCGRVTVYSRLAEGRFPRWRDVLPVRPDAQRIALTVGPFFGAVRQAAILTSEESRGVDFTFSPGNLVLTGRAAEAGQSRIELPLAYEGAELGITLDPRYVNDFLKVLDPDKGLTLELKDAESAAVYSTDDGYAYVIMPLARER
jgi:DNA polymerase-3 subunit beta